MVRVSFDYDEESKKWIPWVSGAGNSTEARQAFSAVVVTCQMLDERLLNHTAVSAEEYGHAITPVA